MKKIYLITIFLSFCIACKKENNTNTLMISPSKNEVCVGGKEINNDKILIDFNWKSIDNEYTYLLYVKNISNSSQPISEYRVNETKYTLPLNKNQIYTWYVTGLNSEKTSIEEWKFYVSSPSTTYVLTPAIAVYPQQGSYALYNAFGIDLRWSSESNSKCDLYFGITQNPPLIRENLTGDTFGNFSVKINVEKEKTHYWKVVSKNEFGHKTISPLFQFYTN
jgi:hypothetical protein